MIHVTEDGWVILSRCEFNYRNGNRPMASGLDGDIVLGQITEDASVDLKDARIMVDWINKNLPVVIPDDLPWMKSNTPERPA